MYRSLFRPLLIASALSLFAATAQADDVLYVKQGAFLNARNGPGTQYAADQVLQPGTQVSVLQRQGDWMQVRTPDGAQAWVFGSYLGDQSPQSGSQSKPQAESAGNTPPQSRDQDQPRQQQTRQLDMGQQTGEDPDQARDQRPGHSNGQRRDARSQGQSRQGGPQGQSGQRPQRGQSQRGKSKQHRDPVQDRPRQVVSQQWAQQSTQPQWTASQSQSIEP